MRIIIELDSGPGQPNIKTTADGGGEVQLTNAASGQAAIDAGFAKIPEPESIIPVHNFSTSEGSSDAQTEAMDMIAKAVDGGTFNASESSSDSAMIATSYKNELAIAASSGAASDAGMAKLSEDFFSESAITPEDNGLQSFDRSKAISAGEFSSQQTE